MGQMVFSYTILTFIVLTTAQNYGISDGQPPPFAQFYPSVTSVNTSSTTIAPPTTTTTPTTTSTVTSTNSDYINAIAASSNSAPSIPSVVSPQSSDNLAPFGSLGPGEVGGSSVPTGEIFGLPPPSAISQTSNPLFQTVYQSPLTFFQTAERRTFDLLTGGGGGGGYGGGDGYGMGGGVTGALTSILTPIAGAAAAALTGGGGASLISLPNANIQPTLQKTFVVNMGGNNPPLIVQGNAYQPGASAGSPAGGKGYSNYGGGGGKNYGGGAYGGRRYNSYGPPPPPPVSLSSAASHQVPQTAQSRGYTQYPNSPTLPQVAGKLGLANLLNMAKQSGFLENLLIGGPFTFFAPSDEAFTKVPKLLLDQASKRPELARQMLLYHIVPDTITTRHFINDLQLPTLNTKKVRINLYQLGYKKIATVNGAVILKPDQYIINGVIHVIDRVLFPVANGTILQIINGPNCQPFDVISTVLAIAGLYDTLNSVGPYTAFLPNTESFGAIPAEERDKILQNQTLVREAFLYHIVPGTYYSQGLQDGQWLDTLSSFGVPLQVGMVSDGSSRRFDSVNGAVRIVKADIPAENGVIHIVDKLITPFQTYFTCLDN
ncbi:hypothetical protein CHUAL_012666 [Chamberlinius hualienensis]